MTGEACCTERQVNMSNINKRDRKHLTLSQRIIIEKGLNDNESFSSIARKIGKDPSTISKEVRRHITDHIKSDMGRDIPCANRSDCTVRGLCNDAGCISLCSKCKKYKFYCTQVCPEYEERTCVKLRKVPYVCNGCVKKNHCFMRKSLYFAKHADDSYRNLLVASREGINQTPADVAMIDKIISPLLKKGQSLAHIYAHHGSEIPCCRKTLYNYIDKSLFTARNIDMRRRVRYKARKRPTRVSTSARRYRTGRTYADFQDYMKAAPNTPVVEMDTVEGKKGKGSKVFLTMLFRNCSLMLIFLLRDKTAKSVIDVFDWLSNNLGVDVFKELFPVILTDNGVEFQRPDRLECDQNGEIRTKINYCNPNSSWQKGMLEKNHEYIRLVIPKGKSFNNLTDKDVSILMNHINSEARDKLNGCNPFNLSRMLINTRLHDLLNLEEIDPDEVSLSTELIR